MILDNIKDIKDLNLSEKDIDTIYLYVYMNLESMNDEDRSFWIELLTKIDDKFYEDSNIRTGKL